MSLCGQELRLPAVASTLAEGREVQVKGPNLAQIVYQCSVYSSVVMV